MKLLPSLTVENTTKSLLLLSCLFTNLSLANDEGEPLTEEETLFQKDIKECVEILENTGVVETNDKLVWRLL